MKLTMVLLGIFFLMGVAVCALSGCGDGNIAFADPYDPYDHDRVQCRSVMDNTVIQSGYGQHWYRGMNTDIFTNYDNDTFQPRPGDQCKVVF